MVVFGMVLKEVDFTKSFHVLVNKRNPEEKTENVLVRWESILKRNAYFSGSPWRFLLKIL